MKRENYFPGINLLRIVSCIIIVLFHWYPIVGGGFFRTIPVVDFIISNGGIMVNLFLIISGFCMAANYKKKVMDGMDFKSYFLKHYLKFVSLSLLTTPLGVVSCWLGGEAELPTIPISFSEIIREILCIRCGWVYTPSMPYNGPIWFINVLLIMYIFYYICCKSRNRYFVLCVSFMLLGIFMHYNVGVINLPLINDFSHTGFYNFFAGTILYELYDICKDNMKKVLLWSGVFGLGTILVIISQTIWGNNGWIGDDDIALLFTVWPFLIWIMLFFKPAISFSETKLMKGFNNLTTSIYIWHHPIAYILLYSVVIWDLPIPLNNVFVFGNYFVFVLFVASISSRYIEKKVLNALIFMTGK